MAHAQGCLSGVNELLNQLRQRISTSGKSRYALSRQTGIDQAQLSRLMSGQEGLGYGNLVKLAAALGLEIVLRPVTR